MSRQVQQQQEGFDEDVRSLMSKSSSGRTSPRQPQETAVSRAKFPDRRLVTVLGVKDSQHLMYRGLFAEAKRLNDRSRSKGEKNDSSEKPFVDMEECIKGGPHNLDYSSQEVGFDGDLGKKLKLSDIGIQAKVGEDIVGSPIPSVETAETEENPPEVIVVNSKRFVREITED